MEGAGVPALVFIVGYSICVGHDMHEFPLSNMIMMINHTGGFTTRGGLVGLEAGEDAASSATCAMDRYWRLALPSSIAASADAAAMRT